MSALHLPAVVAAGFPDPEISQELERIFGYAEWPQLLERMSLTIIGILLLLSAVFIIIGRRKGGALHIIRAALGITGLLGTLSLLADILPRNYSDSVVQMLNNNQLGAALEVLLDRLYTEEAFVGAIIFIVSVIILAWPSKKNKSQLVTLNQNQGVAL